MEAEQLTMWKYDYGPNPWTESDATRLMENFKEI